MYSMEIKYVEIDWLTITYYWKKNNTPTNKYQTSGHLHFQYVSQSNQAIYSEQYKRWLLKDRNFSLLRRE